MEVAPPLFPTPIFLMLRIRKSRPSLKGRAGEKMQNDVLNEAKEVFALAS